MNIDDFRAKWRVNTSERCYSFVMWLFIAGIVANPLFQTIIFKITEILKSLITCSQS